MKVLTIRQPFAAAIMEGLKTVEYRSWATSYRGMLAIHAGKRRPDRDWQDDWPELDADTLVYGAILGAVELLDCVPGDAGFEWHLANPRPLDRPFLCGGQLGLWVPPAAVVKLLCRG